MIRVACGGENHFFPIGGRKGEGHFREGFTVKGTLDWVLKDDWEFIKWRLLKG